MKNKRIALCVLLVFSLLLSLVGCGGSYGSLDLHDPISIPDDGIITEQQIKQIQTENAIATFLGESNGFTYEWTIFGSDITDPKEINLQVDIQKRQPEGINVSFREEEPFGFPILLSVHMPEKWNAQGGTAYRDGQAAFSVSVTGSNETILNFAVDEKLGSYEICPNAEVPEQTVMSAPPDATDNTEDPPDDYLSPVAPNDAESAGSTDDGDREISDGSQTGQDEYLTDPVPQGKPLPVEPDDQTVDTEKVYTCTFSIECSTILNNLNDLDPTKREMVPSDGVILPATEVIFYEGESVYDVLQRVCKDNGIQMEASWTPMYNSAYVEGIHNLYEFDCGNLSGWMYRVDNWYPNYGCSRYQLADGEVVEWRYTCDLGKDVGCDWMAGS